jgi:molybdenum cofactor biosynthesis protein B
MPHIQTASPNPRAAIVVATLTISDTRNATNDESGARLRELLTTAGFSLTDHQIVPDEGQAIRAAIDDIMASHRADAIVTTGGTGIAARDVTVEVIEPLLEKRLDGFGEAFRRLSWDEVGARSVLSRTVAGVYHGRLIAALPGSTNAVTLAARELLVPLLEHAVALLKGETAHHHGTRK